MSNKRDPLSKENFLEGTRQRWALIFIGCAFIVMTATIMAEGFDPVPFMQFFLAIGSIFIVGASGDSWVKASKVGSLRETEAKEKTKRVVDVKNNYVVPDSVIIQNAEDQNSGDLSYAPAEWVRSQEPDKSFR